jgi:hypothetical protein
MSAVPPSTTREWDYDRATADYSEAIRLDPMNANPMTAHPYRQRGLAKKAKGDHAGGDADIASAND